MKPINLKGTGTKYAGVKVKQRTWGPGDFSIIVYAGSTNFLCMENDAEINRVFSHSGSWYEYEEPKPKKKIASYTFRYGDAVYCSDVLSTKEEAELTWGSGLIHWPHGEVYDE